LLSLASQRLGGALEAIDLSTSPFRLSPVTATFHGRDLFAPVAARLAQGAALSDAGEPIETETLTQLELPEPRLYADRVVAHVLYVDGFGNVALNLNHEQLASTFLRLGQSATIDTGRARVTVPFGRTFTDVAEGEGLIYEDSSKSLALAINRQSAGEMLGLAADDEIVLLPAT
jgi:S-adenosylmethionine hydrolase